MKVIAIETVFIFILSMLAATVLIIFFSNIKDAIFNFFKEKNQLESFELEIIIKEKFSKNYLLELASLCTQKAENSKLDINVYVCFYLKSNKNFEEIMIENFDKINIENFDAEKNYLLIVYNKKEKTIYFIN
ncbi:MAG: hypothetical protein QXO40_02515 [Candidatus Aenigmatarchaeota archaeon]